MIILCPACLKPITLPISTLKDGAYTVDAMCRTPACRGIYRITLVELRASDLSQEEREKQVEARRVDAVYTYCVEHVPPSGALCSARVAIEQARCRACEERLAGASVAVVVPLTESALPAQSIKSGEIKG